MLKASSFVGSELQTSLVEIKDNIVSVRNDGTTYYVFCGLRITGNIKNNKFIFAVDM
ncbi:MAG: hypothetical protein WCK13_04475 [Ignavibacteriota bacterium]|nr:hypothetical protein [Ignavibacteriota bacterium]